MNNIEQKLQLLHTLIKTFLTSAQAPHTGFEQWQKFLWQLGHVFVFGEHTLYTGPSVMKICMPVLTHWSSENS